MRKNEIIVAILEKLREAFENRRRVSRNIRDSGNDAESKSEGKYDTRSTEENYLADGLARQALAAAEAAAAIEKMQVRPFAPGDPIDTGALVELRFPGASEWFLMASAGGGIEVLCDGKMVTVLAHDSPLGSQLMGLHVGECTRKPKTSVSRVL